MGFLEIFNKKKYELPEDKSAPKLTAESNTLFGQTQLGNNVMIGGKDGKRPVSTQLLYVTTSSNTVAGRTVDMSVLARNSTVQACVGTKARALAQLPIQVMYIDESGTFVDALKSEKAGTRDKTKAKQVLNLLQNPNNFQSPYEFWYQTSMWLDMAGETFTLWWRTKQDDPNETPKEMYNLDATLITAQINETRYPTYRLSTSTYGFNKETNLTYYQVMHLMEQSWQGAGGWNKGILATELVGLDQDIDLYANFVMQNGAKPSGLFTTQTVIPDSKYKEVAQRLKETFNQLTGSRDQDPSKAGQGMLLDQGMEFKQLDMLTLQDADAAQLKMQTMKRICGLFGVPPAMIGIADQKYNNTQTMMSEFYKSTMGPLVRNIEQKLKQHLLKGYPNLVIKFDTKEFLNGDPLDQMNLAVAGVNAGIITPNEAREYLGMGNVDGADELKDTQAPAQKMQGQSPQDTGGGGGSQKRKMNIGQ